MTNHVVLKSAYFVLAALVVCGCSRNPYAGPDKQFGGMLESAATGAGAGAVTGFQLGAGTGSGALAGAGVGAIAGSVRGMMQDEAEEEMMAHAVRLQEERERARAQEILQDHFKRRLALHPTRDILPADLFFAGDSSTLRADAVALVRELAELNKRRLPWSRLGVTVYVKAEDAESNYARELAEKRSKALGDCMVSSGIEPRRIEARGVVVAAPLLVDPDDIPTRYSQAVEITALDR